MIKHIFSDMDGTLLNPAGQLTDATIQAVKHTDIPFTLVSARAPMEMASTIQSLALDDAQIAFNGGLIFKPVGDHIQPISERSIDSRVAASIIRTLSYSFPHVSLSYYDREHWYTNRLDEGIEFEQRLTGQKAIITSHNEAFAQPDFKVFKIMLITFDLTEMNALYHTLMQFNLPNVSIKQSGDTYLEITSLEAKKSRGINYILHQERLDAADTAGFGDGYNDLPMLNMVGLPIVMANAFDEIKTVAKFVTKSNEEDGVAYALNTLNQFHV